MRKLTDIIKSCIGHIKKDKWALIGLGLLAATIAVEKAYEKTPEERRKRIEQRWGQEKLEFDDMEQTGEYFKILSKHDSHFDIFYSTKFADWDGIQKVQISDMDDKLIWEQSREEFKPSISNMWEKNRNGDYLWIWITVPRMQDGTYKITVFDKKGNSFNKEVYFRDK